MDVETQLSSAAGTAIALITTYGLRVVGAIIILLAGWITSRIVYGRRRPAVPEVVAHRPHGGAVPRQRRALHRARLHLRRGAHHLRHRHHELRGRAGRARHRHRLALQGTLSNLAAGIMLVLFRPFHIGDRIETANVGGNVCEINLFFTEIDGDDQ
jgi:small conductance mechanosensitive channel